MCGILAICQTIGSIHFTESLDAAAILASYNHLYNRGPDSGSLQFREREVLGFRRLAVVDTSTKGNQPFEIDDVALLCNGEIYNHRELRKEFNLNCESDSDCECILHLYLLLGFEETVRRLRGDYALVVVTPENILFARDPVGVRPLFYGFTPEGHFALASYARALVNICELVRPVLPGYGICHRSEGQLVCRPYSHSVNELSVVGNQKLLETIEQSLVEAVSIRLMSDRPMACLLSGGLDSSLITSILCKLIGAENVRTYSIGMKGSHDLKCAQHVAEHLGTQHTEVVFTPEEGFAVLPEVIRDLESDDITTVRASVGMWLLARHISQETNDIVLLSGEGADELFCGYLYFHYAPDLTTLSQESVRLVQELYLYDVLRADRCISSHGLELRVPFLDKKMVELCMSLHGAVRAPKSGIEKHLLREAFQDGYLPPDILWRRKDGFSDGVSGNEGKKWFEQLQDFVDLEVDDDEFAEHGSEFPSKEAYFYRKTFDHIFPTYRPPNGLLDAKMG